VEPARGEPDDRVPGARGARVDEPRPLHDADAEAGQVELVLRHQARVLRGLSADERTARLAAALGDAGHQLGHVERVQPAHGDVVEERDGLRAGARDVVGAHRDQVHADRVVPPQGGRDGRLRPDAVGRGHDDGLPDPGRAGERGAESAEVAQDLGPAGGGHRRPHQLHRALARRDVHPAFR